MYTFNNITDNLIDEFCTRFSVAEDDVLMMAEADRNADGEYREVYVALTSSSLLIMEGNIEGRNGFTGEKHPMQRTGILRFLPFIKRKKPQKAPTRFLCEASRLIPRQELTAIEIIDQACNGVLCIRKQDDYEVIANFSGSKAKQLHRFARLATILLEGREIAESDTKDDRFVYSCPKCGKPYPNQEVRTCPHCQNRKALWIRLFKYLKPYRWRYALVCLLMLISAGIGIIRPYLSGTVFIDEVLNINGKYYGQVLPVVLLVLASGIANLLIGTVIRGRINARIATEMSNDIRKEIFNALQKLSMTFFGNNHTGSLMTRVNDDAGEIQHFFIDALPNLLIQGLTMFGIAIYLFCVNWKVALAILLPLPVVLFLILKYFPKIRRSYDRIWVANTGLNSSISDSINGSRVIRAFSTEKNEKRRFAVKNFDLKSTTVKLRLFQSTFYPLFQLVTGVSLVLIWGFGSLQIMDGNLTIGELSTMISYITMVFGPITRMSEYLFWWSNATNSAQRVFEILDAVPDVTDAPDAVSVETINGDIQLNNVSFFYTATKPILTDVSVEIKAGQMMGIVGHSGAGKSTLVNLINRLYDVKLGSITIDGIDIRKLKNAELKRFVGVVSQETYIFVGTVWENIAFACPTATKEEILNAAVSSHAHEFIMKLPNGYDTVIGSGVRELSGGEKQRISIARAILHNPKILILDEATSAVDTETEKFIQESLERLVKGRTTISIAHRLSTLRNADFIIVIENGQIVENGTHDELIHNKDGAYYKLNQLQAQALSVKGV